MSLRWGLPMLLRSLGFPELLRVNRAFTEQLGLGTEELERKPFLQWVHPDDRQAMIERLEEGGGCVQARHQTASGKWIELDWTIRNERGIPVAMGRLRRPEDSALLARSKTKPELKAGGADTLDSMALLVEEKNPGKRCSILLVDPACSHIVGGAGPSLPDAYNSAVEGLSIGPGVGSCGTAAFWNTPVVVENIETDPLWADLRDAAKIAGVAACWSHPIASTDGQVLGAMALYSDEPCAPTRHQMNGLEIAARMVGLAIEHDRLEEQLRQATKMEAIGVLAGGIAHDFNNLLASVLGNAELALGTLTPDAEAQQMIEEIVVASASATDLCNQMLAYAGRGARTIEPLECNGLVEELGGLLQVAISKKARIRYELHDSPLGVLADHSQMKQVIMNLITNAADAVGDSEGEIVVGTEVRKYTRAELDLDSGSAHLEPGEYVRLWVSDTGCGMSEETQASIFDPFFTTKSHGRGLGLAAVQGIVRGHNGAIQLKTALGEGTTFSVLLPSARAPEDALPEARTLPDVDIGARVLVVDDEAPVRRMLCKVLERGGYSVVRASNGEEALEVFRREAGNIDCVILDFSMPKLNGGEVFRELRRIQKDVCVILSSGFTEQEMMDRFDGEGLAGIMQKPTPMHTILEKTATAIASRAAHA